jgi:hypothetical protein
LAERRASSRLAVGPRLRRLMALDGARRCAAVCHQEIDGEVWTRRNFKLLDFSQFRTAVDNDLRNWLFFGDGSASSIHAFLKDRSKFKTAVGVPAAEHAIKSGIASDQVNPAQIFGLSLSCCGRSPTLPFRLFGTRKVRIYTGGNIPAFSH